MILVLVAVLAGALSPLDETQASLQSMVDGAPEGATLRVPAGVYSGPITISKPLTLDGHGEVTIEGPGRGDVIVIEAADTTLRGLTIRGTGSSLDKENAGIVGTAPRITVEDCTLQDVLFGIYLKEAPHSVIRGNTIGAKDLEQARRGDGIRLWTCPDSLIEQNRVDGGRDCIMWFSDRTTLRRNHVTNGRYGMHFMYSDQNVLEDNVLADNSVGAFLMYSQDLTLRRNVLARNRGPSGFGIGLKELDGLLAEDNLIVGNREGIHLDNSPSILGIEHVLRRNVIAYNDVGVAFLPMVSSNRFHENTFLENVEQVAILGTGELRGNAFDLEGRGNYWSDYRGFDLDSDGVGDVEYKANAFFENLIDREPRLRLFLFSPAQHAVTVAARAFPIVQPRTKIEDAFPLMTQVAARIDAASTRPKRGGGLAAILLIAAGVSCLVPLAVRWPRTPMISPRRQDGSEDNR